MAKKPKEQRNKAKGAAAIHRSKSPSQVLPALAYALLSLLLVILSYVNVLSQQTMMVILGGGSLVYLLFICIFQIYFKLRHKIVAGILLAVSPVWIVGCSYMIFRNVYYPAPVMTGELTRGQRTLDIDLPGGAYSLFIKGEFKEAEAEAEAKTDEKTAKKDESGKKSTDQKKIVKKPAPRKLQKGNFVVTLTGSGGAIKSKNFSGMLESGDVKRKLSKRARGTLHVEETSSIFKFRFKDAVSYQLKLTTLDEKLDDKLKMEIYPRSYLPIIFTILALICLPALSFVDFLMKASREFSFFAYGFAVSFGFASYFHLMATPYIDLKVMVMALVVGVSIGLSAALAAEYALAKTFREFNRKKKISLI
jgi:hypothetical protein